MSFNKIRVVLLVSLFLSLPARAGTTIHVPADQPTIQDAINAASNGDTVLVSPGTYYENIAFNGKAITVTSASGPAATIIDGHQAGAVVSFQNGETLTSVLSGFTLQNGSTSGIYVGSSSPTITGNVLTLNGECGAGVIAVYSGAPLIQGNLIAGNLTPECFNSEAIFTSDDTGIQIVGNIVSANNGAGINLYSESGIAGVIQNTITQNAGLGFFHYGGGSSSVTLVQNLIANNLGPGVSWYFPPITAVSNTIVNNAPGCCVSNGSEISANTVDSTAVLENNLIVATGSVPAFFCANQNSPATLTNNDVFSGNGAAYGGSCPDPTGTNGNISADPLFVDLLSDNVLLQSGSPAINAGINSAPDEPKTDFDGDARIQGGTIDIGADEYVKKTALAVSSHDLHFAAQDVGTSSTPQIVTLTNQKSTAVTLNLIATGANFSQTNNCGTSLAAGASCQINVIFTPLTGSSIDGVLGIFTNATLNPVPVDLVGTALAPQVQFFADFSFFNQVIGTSSTQTGTLTNVGQGPLTINSIVNNSPADFVESNNCPIAPNSLAAEGSCTVSVTYTPTLIGFETGALTFNDNALPNPQIFNMSGSSVSAGAGTFAPSTLTFPTTLIGQSSAIQTSKLTNTGTGALGITSISSFGDFPETNNCPTSLAVGASCTLSVTYTPSVQGTEFGSVTVFTDSASFEVSLSLTGTGQAPVPAITSLSIVSVPVGSADTQITITGSGFVFGSELVWNGTEISCCAYPNGTTQLNATIPAADLAAAGTNQVSVFTPAPGGGTSNSLPFTVYTPINYAVAPTKYAYTSISGTNLNLAWFEAAVFTSPFPIQFGGGSYTNLTVGAGGTISFSGSASQFNDVIPTTEAATLVAPYWANLYPFGAGNDNNVFWAVIGGAPNRELVVEWRNVPYCCGNNAQNTIKFQVVFHEGSSNILFNYADTLFGGAYSADNNGATATSGVQVAPGVGTQYSYNQPSLMSKTSLLWYPGSPTATLSTSSLGFGYHQIGIKSQAQTLTLTNGSVVPLVISGITTDNPDFTETNNCGTTLDSSLSCTIQVFFNASGPSTESSTLTITDNATNSPQTAALTGIGTITPIEIYPIMANFGSIKVGSSGTIPVVLANGSNRPLTIQQITTSGSVYSETNNCGPSLAAGASCAVSVTFTPAQQGSVTGTLSMALNGKPTVAEVKLVGSGQ